MPDNSYYHNLLFKKLEGRLDEEETLLLEKALAEDPSLLQRWQELQQIFNEPSVKAQFDSIDQEGIFRQIVENPVRRRTIAWKAAAAILVLVLAGTAMFFLNQKAPEIKPEDIYVKLADGKVVVLPKQGTVNAGEAMIRANGDSAAFQGQDATGSWNTLVVPRKHTYTVMLPDGSTVKLNAATTLKFPFRFPGTTREVYINGEGYFTIAANASQPFIIRTEKGSVQVLGTRFNINTYEGAFRTSLAQGTVQVITGQDTAVLAPGQRSILAGNDLGIEAFDPDDDMSWISGIIYLDSISVDELARIVERTYDMAVKISHDSIHQAQITGSLDTRKPVDVLVRNLNSLGGVRFTCRLAGDTLYFE